MNISVSIKGLGSEVCQGSIPTSKFENFKSFDLNWNDFCQKELELDGYWEINNISHLTGISTDNAEISIMINKNEVWSVGYHSLFPDDDESSVYTKDQGVMAIGSNSIPENSSLITSITSEYFDVKEDVEIKIGNTNIDIQFPSDDNYKFFINDLELGFIIASTDEMAYGADYGDFILGFIFNKQKIYFEYPGGMGLPKVFLEKKPDWLK